VFERVTTEARRRGVDVLASELVGLLPADALAAVGEHYLRFAQLDATAIIETRLLEHALSAE
ncbi:MAG TPA: glutamate formiminotransferase, partial [Chloroflexota bacterium]|nr:glutamate formiminotransferase [Chloroflexota bacterium]